MVDEKKVGYLVLKETGEEIYIENILVAEEFQNLGIGTIVMERLIQEAAMRGLDMRLQVFKINIKAQRFYSRHGFVKIGEKKDHIKMERKFNSL